MAVECPRAPPAVILEGLDVPATLGMALHLQRLDDRLGREWQLDVHQKLSLRLRISAKTSASDAPSHHEIASGCRHHAAAGRGWSASPARVSSALVNSSSCPDGVDIGRAVFQGLVLRIDGQRETGIGQGVFVAEIDGRCRPARPSASAATPTSAPACLRTAGRSRAQTACRRKTGACRRGNGSRYARRYARASRRH